MALISESIKDIVSINIKERHDDHSDQFSRIFIVKMLVMSALITSMDFFNDSMSCILPEDTKMDASFAHSVCWIQGFYVYDELFHRLKESSSYGMPKDIEIDGITSQGKLCRRLTKLDLYPTPNPDCHPLTKVYFNQYQYMPFYIASLAVLYYVPYIIFRVTNTDMINLSTEITADTEGEKLAYNVANSYFNYGNNGGVFGLRARVIGTSLVKVLYVFINFCGFVLTDTLLNNRFCSYGIEWIQWSKLNNTLAHDYNELRGYPKPGNHLLPSMGFCDIHEAGVDKRQVFTNRHRVICEISPHILYQYVLIVLWFVLVTGIIISVTGCALYLINVLTLTADVTVMRGCQMIDFQTGFNRLTVREIQYMKFIRKKNSALYKDVFKLVHQETIV